jgi:hypothetical protein
MHNPSVLYANEPRFNRVGLYTKAPLFTILYGFKSTPRVLPFGGANTPLLLTPVINSSPYFKSELFSVDRSI